MNTKEPFALNWTTHAFFLKIDISKVNVIARIHTQRIKIQISYVCKNCPISNRSTLVQVMVWCRACDKPLYKLMMAQFTDALKGHLAPWVNTLWHSVAIRWQRSGSTLDQVMVCCLMAPSHHPNQCWLPFMQCVITWEQVQATILYNVV